MKIYTKTGDDGTTGLFGGTRVKKTDIRVEAYGTVDELNAVLGLARAKALSPHSEDILSQVQVDLFTLGAELACAPEKLEKLPMKLLESEDAVRLEHAIDRGETKLSPLKNFILPGGSEAAAVLHFARTVCRRAERATLAIGGVRETLVIYLNRLSDLLFVLARVENHELKVEDVPWAPRT